MSVAQDYWLFFILIFFLVVIVVDDDDDDDGDGEWHDCLGFYPRLGSPRVSATRLLNTSATRLLNTYCV